MPAPLVVAGMAGLGAILTKLGELFLDLFLKKYTRRVALNLTYLALLASLFVGFAVALAAIMHGIHAVAPEFLAQATGMFMPAEMPMLISAYLTAHLTDFVFTIKVKLAKPKYGLF